MNLGERSPVVADDGLTFGTNSSAGVCVYFSTKVSAVLGRKDHSALTVTVDDVSGLVEALEEKR